MTHLPNSKIRPKIWVDPHSGEYYRLVPGNPDSDYGRGYYKKITLPSTEVHFYKMNAERLNDYKNLLLCDNPPGFHVRELRLQNDTHQPLQEGEISQLQLYELMNALGNDSGWWPTEDPNYDAVAYFSKLKINILFDGQKPVAVHMWDDSLLASDGKIIGSFIGTVPEYRGHHYGSYMIKWGLQKLARMGCREYYLNTGDDDLIPATDAHPRPIPAKLYYEKLGFEYQGSQTISPYTIKTTRAAIHGMPISFSDLTMSDEFYKHPVTGQPLRRYTDKIISTRLTTAFSNNR